MISGLETDQFFHPLFLLIHKIHLDECKDRCNDDQVFLQLALHKGLSPISVGENSIAFIIAFRIKAYQCKLAGNQQDAIGLRVSSMLTNATKREQLRKSHMRILYSSNFPSQSRYH